MKWGVHIFLSFCLISPGFAQDRVKEKQPKAIGYSTRDATVMSIMGWGIILACIVVGVSVIFKEPSTNTSSTN